MNIRDDFKSVEMLLGRLLQFSVAFEENKKDWSHFKNKEDFDEVYRLDWDLRNPLENIYRNGGDLANFMSSKLKEFNFPYLNPTLKGYVDSFNNGWIYQVEILKSDSQAAKDICKDLNHVPWAINQMIMLFDRQIELIIAVKHTIDSLKETDIYKWESGLAQQSFPIPEYNKILDCIHSIGKMFERLPSTYAGKDEESLRDHILVTLQGLVAGSATGESFNKRGKTDILVRNQSSSEFVGECKFWRGKVVFLDTITQLLSYLTWRDKNTGIIFFVPNHDFSAVLEKVTEYVSEHPQFLRETGVRDKAWHNFEFRMAENTSSVINVAIMLYHIPSSV